LDLLIGGIKLKDGITRLAEVKIIGTLCLLNRVPPIRLRKKLLDSWLAITIYKGRNRQIRRMTVAVGYPTLRLIRIKIGSYSLNNLMPEDFETIA